MNDIKLDPESEKFFKDRKAADTKRKKDQVNSITHSDTEEGIVIGLIDSLITISAVLAEKKTYSLAVENEKVYQALKDLHEDENLYHLLQWGPFNRRVMSEDNIELWEQIKKLNKVK